MHIADACWRQTPSGGAADAVGWAGGLATVRAGADDSMERLYSGFSGGERSVQRPVGRSGSVYGTEAQLLDLSSGSATHARRTLLDSGDPTDTPDGLTVVDPLLADWLRHRFPL